ncbi:MAG: metallophosphoesterase family protein [Pseudomonadota bacterium]|nr:MAG: metallophosphoesterase family protein [Pseudomonadota bacterium]
MCVALVSDSHGFVDPRVIAAVKKCDCIAHVGDVGSAQVLEQLGAAGKFYTVRCNNDLPANWPPGNVHGQGRCRWNSRSISRVARTFGGRSLLILDARTTRWSVEPVQFE